MDILSVVGILVAVLVIVFFIASAVEKSAAKRRAETPSYRVNEKISPTIVLQMRRSHERLGEISLEVLLFEIRNLYLAGGSGETHCLRLSLQDVTDKPSAPVHCAIELFQAPSSKAFQVSQTLPPLPYGSFLNITSFTKVAGVPLDLLQFPGSGMRRIEAFLEVLSGKKVLATGLHVFELLRQDKGYLEANADRERNEEMAIYLAMHVAGANGTLDLQESEVVKKWVLKQIEATPLERREKRRARLNKVLADAFEKNSTSRMDLSYIAEILDKHAPQPVKYEIIELCMEVMNADGVAEASELREIDRIAKLIGLDEKHYRELLDRRLSTVSVVATSEGGDLRSLVGLTDSMSPEEIRSHLNSEFRKWNARSTSNDASVRKRAEEMLSHIAEARKKFL
jgi:uncharacterized tellurite resistance protein B-like protein